MCGGLCDERSFFVGMKDGEHFSVERTEKIISKLHSGLRLSVGFDEHRVEDYLPDRIHSACRKITEFQIPLLYG